MAAKPNHAGFVLKVGIRLILIAGCAATLFSADAPVVGTWRAKTATLTIAEVGLRTYRITFGEESMTLGLVPAEITVACNGREEPLSGAVSPGMTAMCPRKFPNRIEIRIREDGDQVGELTFNATRGATSLKYVIAKAGHVSDFLLERQ